MSLRKILNRVMRPVLALPRPMKRLVAMAIDACACVFALWLALFLRLGALEPMQGNVLVALVVSVALALPIFLIFGLYRTIFRYSGVPTVLSCVRAVMFYGVFYIVIFTAISFDGVPRTVGIIQPILLLFLVAGSRVLTRYWLGESYSSHVPKERKNKVLIYGAGSAGRQLAMALKSSAGISVAGFLDDDKNLAGRELNGLLIYDPLGLPNLVRDQNIQTVLLAIPTLSRTRRNQIIEQIGRAHVQVRTLPSLSELAQGRVAVSALRDLDIDDLLGRAHVPPEPHLLSKNILGKTVLVTGAGGSIGSELCRLIVAQDPICLILLDSSEYALYTIHKELLQIQKAELLVIPLLGSVTDAVHMESILRAWQPSTLYHAAAYKHVPLVEHNVVPGVFNNVIGTWTCAQLALRYGVENFVLISTDKSVRPTNVMGASKRLAEMVLQALAHKALEEQNAAQPMPCFSMVRFGNVLGSSGSVVPLFREQIKNGGPITLTHHDITRYFMTMTEAAQLVIQAGSMACGGEVFVLDMGESVRIIDLAKRMIALSGQTVRDQENPGGDIEIQITELRPGEKLYEELLIGDNPSPTSHARIQQANELFTPWLALEPQLNILCKQLASGDSQAVRASLQAIVVDYQPTSSNVDFLAAQTLNIHVK
jgi:FlaA1/EpsC-like NDP-sugar epimerase